MSRETPESSLHALTHLLAALRVQEPNERAIAHSLRALIDTPDRTFCATLLLEDVHRDDVAAIVAASSVFAGWMATSLRGRSVGLDVALAAHLLFSAHDDVYGELRHSVAHHLLDPSIVLQARWVRAARARRDVQQTIPVASWLIRQANDFCAALAFASDRPFDEALDSAFFVSAGALDRPNEILVLELLGECLGLATAGMTVRFSDESTAVVARTGLIASTTSPPYVHIAAPDQSRVLERNVPFFDAIQLHGAVVDHITEPTGALRKELAGLSLGEQAVRWNALRQALRAELHGDAAADGDIGVFERVSTRPGQRSLERIVAGEAASATSERRPSGATSPTSTATRRRHQTTGSRTIVDSGALPVVEPTMESNGRQVVGPAARRVSSTEIPAVPLSRDTQSEMQRVTAKRDPLVLGERPSLSTTAPQAVVTDEATRKRFHREGRELGLKEAEVDALLRAYLEEGEPGEGARRRADTETVHTILQVLGHTLDDE